MTPMVRTLVATLCLWATAALAQVPIVKQPELSVLKAALENARAKRPLDSAPLLALKQGPIDATLADDLQKFDWYLPGAWSYPEKKFGVTWSDDDCFQYDLNRYLPDGTELSFTFSINRLDATKMQLTHVNFTQPPPTSVAVRKVGKQTYWELTAYGVKELHRVVSYEKGVLVLDVSYDGKPNSKKVKFREVRIALPRHFESTGS